MRKKTKKMRGRKTAGWGARKKHRGKGSRGGKGMSGSGKRGDQKKTFILAKIGKGYYGKRGFAPPTRKGSREINLDQITEALPTLLAKEIAKKSGEEFQIDLTKAGYTKLLGRGKAVKTFLIKVKSYSKKAKEKIEEAGGKIINGEGEAREEKEKEPEQSKKAQEEK